MLTRGLPESWHKSRPGPVAASLRPWCIGKSVFQGSINARYAAFRGGFRQERLAFEREADLTCKGEVARGRRNPSLSVMARIANMLTELVPKLLGD